MAVEAAKNVLSLCFVSQNLGRSDRARLYGGRMKMILARTDKRLDPGSSAKRQRQRLAVWICLAGSLVGEKVLLQPMMELAR